MPLPLLQEHPPVLPRRRKRDLLATNPRARVPQRVERTVPRRLLPSPFDRVRGALGDVRPDSALHAPLDALARGRGRVGEEEDEESEGEDGDDRSTTTQDIERAEEGVSEEDERVG